jgi:hypothetical protein
VIINANKNGKQFTKRCNFLSEAKGVQESDIDEIEAKFPGLFTREQLRGTLENYKNDKD